MSSIFQLFELEFDKLFFSVIFQKEKESLKVMSKGAIERILQCCTSITTPDRLLPLDSKMEADILSNVEQLAAKGLRVIAFASRTWIDNETKERNRNDVESELSLIGLMGLYDPPRVESKPSVLACHRAGITVVSISFSSINFNLFETKLT